MHFDLSPPDSRFINCVDCEATLTRLIGNLRGFVYRRRPDARWTMEFVSAGCLDVTGYEPHRFIANASLAFGDLIAPADRPRVDERVRFAIRQRQRATVEYRIRTAHGAWALVEDRFAPVVNTAGEVLAIEGVMDRVRQHHPAPWPRARRARTASDTPETALLPLHSDAERA